MKKKLKHALRERDHALLKDYGFAQVGYKWRDGSGVCIERRSGAWWCDRRKLTLPLAAWLARRAIHVDEEPTDAASVGNLVHQQLQGDFKALEDRVMAYYVSEYRHARNVDQFWADAWRQQNLDTGYAKVAGHWGAK